MRDDIDEKVLGELQRDAKQTTGSIAKRIRVPTTTVHNRIKRMERDGVIKTYRPVLDHAKLGRGIGALIFIQAEGKSTNQGALLERLCALPGVTGGKIVTGGFDLLIEARVGSMEELNHLLIERIRHITGVDKTQTMMILDERDGNLRH